jgi:hypothetical protein
MVPPVILGDTTLVHIQNFTPNLWNEMIQRKRGELQKNLVFVVPSSAMGLVPLMMHADQEHLHQIVLNHFSSSLRFCLFFRMRLGFCSAERLYDPFHTLKHEHCQEFCQFE